MPKLVCSRLGTVSADTSCCEAEVGVASEGTAPIDCRAGGVLASGGELPVRHSSLAEHLHSALLEHERVVAELRRENEQLRGQLRLSAEPTIFGRVVGPGSGGGGGGGGSEPPENRMLQGRGNSRGSGGSEGSSNLFAPLPRPDFDGISAEGDNRRGDERGKEDSEGLYKPLIALIDDVQLSREKRNRPLGEDAQQPPQPTGDHEPCMDAEGPLKPLSDDEDDHEQPEKGNNMTFETSEECDVEQSTDADQHRHSDGELSATSSRQLKSLAFVHQPADDEAKQGILTRFIKGPLETIASVVIVLNTSFLFFQLQQNGYVIGSRQGFGNAGAWAGMDGTLHAVEHIFNAIFCLELGLRLFALRSKYFCGPEGVDRFNMFDFVLVTSSSLDLYVIQPLGEAMNMSMFRPLRFLRLLRALRVLQLFRSLLPLRILVKTVAASFMALFWSISLLLIVMLMTALFLCQMLSGSIEDQAIAEETRQWVYRMYGTSSRSVWTVFELTFSGCWPNYVRALVEEVDILYAIFFAAYIVMVIFAMFRIITALFLKDTLAAAAADAELALVEAARSKQAYANQMLAFFQAANVSGDGLLTRKEFNTMMEDPEVQTWFSIMDVDVYESAEFFELLASNGRVSSSDFVNGIPRLKGQARSQDMVAVRLLSKHMKDTLHEIRDSMLHSEKSRRP